MSGFKRKEENYFLIVRRSYIALFSSYFISVSFFILDSNLKLSTLSCDGRNSKVIHLLAPLRFHGLLLEIHRSVLQFTVISSNIWHVQLLRLGCRIGRGVRLVIFFQQASVLEKEGQENGYRSVVLKSLVSRNFYILKHPKELLILWVIHITH